MNSEHVLILPILQKYQTRWHFLISERLIFDSQPITQILPSPFMNFCTVLSFSPSLFFAIAVELSVERSSGPEVISDIQEVHSQNLTSLP